MGGMDAVCNVPTQLKGAVEISNISLSQVTVVAGAVLSTYPIKKQLKA